jgi:hypothetical protein
VGTSMSGFFASIYWMLIASIRKYFAGIGGN